VGGWKELGRSMEGTGQVDGGNWPGGWRELAGWMEGTGRVDGGKKAD